MTDKIQWYDVLTVCYRQKLERSEMEVFKEAVTNATEAGNKEMCDAIQFASQNELKPIDKYGRVVTLDVIRWVHKHRDMLKKQAQPKVDIITLPVVHRFINEIQDGLKHWGLTTDDVERRCFSLVITNGTTGKETFHLSTCDRWRIFNEIMDGIHPDKMFGF